MYWKIFPFSDDPHFSALIPTTPAMLSMGTHVRKARNGLFRARLTSATWECLGGGVYKAISTFHADAFAGDEIGAAMGAIMAYDDTPFFEN